MKHFLCTTLEGKIPLQGIHHLKDLTPISTAMNECQDNACMYSEAKKLTVPSEL
jgi:hypothetical protein